MKTGSYPILEGVSLQVTSAGVFSIDGTVLSRPDEAKVRAEVRSRYGYAVTLGPWRLDGTTWRCAIISKLKVVAVKKSQI